MRRLSSGDHQHVLSRPETLPALPPTSQPSVAQGWDSLLSLSFPLLSVLCSHMYAYTHSLTPLSGPDKSRARESKGMPLEGGPEQPWEGVAWVPQWESGGGRQTFPTQCPTRRSPSSPHPQGGSPCQRDTASGWSEAPHGISEMREDLTCLPHILSGHREPRAWSQTDPQLNRGSGQVASPLGSPAVTTCGSRS